MFKLGISKELLLNNCLVHKAKDTVWVTAKEESHKDARYVSHWKHTQQIVYQYCNIKGKIQNQIQRKRIYENIYDAFL